MTPMTVTVLAWIGALYVALFLAVALLFAASELLARVRAVRVTRAARENAAMLCERRAALIAEPDPIESYPTGILDIKKSPTPIAPVLLTNAPFVLGNPITNQFMTPKVRQ